jgi:hypothetical protein
MNEKIDNMVNKIFPFIFGQSAAKFLMCLGIKCITASCLIMALVIPKLSFKTTKKAPKISDFRQS